MLNTHGDRKYRSETLLGPASEWPGMRVERRRIGSGRQNAVRSDCTELVHVRSGHARIRRRGDGQMQEAMALPGTTWLVPAGTVEDFVEQEGSTECLIVFLPGRPFSDDTLIRRGIDPERARLAYAGGFCDDVVTRLAAALHAIVEQGPGPFDSLVVDGIGTALAARLIDGYRADVWRPEPRPRARLEPHRLRKVLDLIETRLGGPLRVEDLAREACLSPFHFARLFTRSVGHPPHVYVSERRVRAAEAMLAGGAMPIAEIALEVGFGSQANFSRAFKKTTGLAPGQYRSGHRPRAEPKSTAGKAELAEYR